MNYAFKKFKLWLSLRFWSGYRMSVNSKWPLISQYLLINIQLIKNTKLYPYYNHFSEKTMATPEQAVKVLHTCSK